MRQFRVLARSLRRMIWGEPSHSLDTCLILPRKRILYAYVPKAACTSIKTWLLRHSGENPDIAAQFDRAEKSGTTPPDAHDTMSAYYHAKRQPARLVRAALCNPDWFRFTFVRNPLRRLVSAYLDKVVNAKITAREIIALGQASAARAAGSDVRQAFDAQRSLSFREFVDALQAVNPQTVDLHFRAQDRLLRGLNFDYVGQIERLPQDFAAVQNRLGVNVPLTWKHLREYSVSTLECVADWPAARFRNVAVPAWETFYDEPLRQAVSKLYAADFQRFAFSTAVRSAESASANAA